MLQLQRWVGNRAIRDVLTAAEDVLDTPARMFGVEDLRIGGSVGRGGQNDPQDVAQVRARLAAVGYSAGEDLDALVAAIERYQAEVVGLHHPDGRIDPGGRTVKALLEMRRGPAAGPRASGGAAPAEPRVSAPAGPAPAPSAPTVQAPVPATAPPAPTTSGPRPPLQDPALERLVAGAHHPAVDAVAGELARLESLAKGLKHSGHSEELGTGRRELVAAIGPLRARIARLGQAGLDAAVAAALMAGFQHALNAVSPYYYQHENIILEYAAGRGGEKKDVFNTCNITSLSMALEALGKSADDYKHKDLIPAIAQAFANDIAVKATDQATGKRGSTLAGLRLPDYVAMCAIARAMRYKPGSPDEILAAGNLAFGGGKGEDRKYGVTNLGTLSQLAREFGANPTAGEFKLDPGAKGDKASSALSDYGERHWKQASAEADRRGRLSELRRRLERETDAKRQAQLEKEIAALAKAEGPTPPPQAEIEAKIPLEQYKRIVLAQIGPELDRGRQVVVGQYRHFVRLESVNEEYIVKDDPGSYTRANMRITWEQARAMGLFWNWLSIG